MPKLSPFTDLAQPRDRNDPVYKVIDEFLERADQKIIAAEIGVSKEAVSDVKCGTTRSKRIWNKIIEKVMARMEQREAFLKYAGRLKDAA